MNITVANLQVVFLVSGAQVKGRGRLLDLFHNQRGGEASHLLGVINLTSGLFEQVKGSVMHYS